MDNVFLILNGGATTTKTKDKHYFEKNGHLDKK